MKIIKNKSPTQHSDLFVSANMKLLFRKGKVRIRFICSFTVAKKSDLKNLNFTKRFISLSLKKAAQY
jgi:hypothetical protein